ncbi:MAG TPA: class I SAM-dependent methyltransferase [Gemmataceae bacterium]|nr:class I SAM-dependent methyltransferase [Gemmataceae bacterium]
MWETLKLRAKKWLGMPLPPKPYEIVWQREAELFGLHRSESSEFFPHFRIAPSDTLVDVGCGIGGACVFAADAGAEVIGVDIDAEMIETASKRLSEETSSRRWQTHVSDSNPLPLKSGIATKVICQEVLEHVDDPAKVLSELARVGRPNALYLLSVPDPVAEKVQKDLAPETYWRKPNHLRIFEREVFDRLVESAGLTIEKTARYSFYWSMWWILFWAEPQVTRHFGGPITPVLRYWNKTWDAVLAAPEGSRIKKALDDFMPKTRFILARKAA